MNSLTESELLELEDWSSQFDADAEATIDRLIAAARELNRLKEAVRGVAEREDYPTPGDLLDLLKGPNE